MYPEGRDELRTFLNRLIPIRNNLSHARPISSRDVEQCVCYCNDFIEYIKEYYIMTGKERDFNVPTIIKAVDSLGNEYQFHDKGSSQWEFIDILDPETKEKKKFFENDSFWIELTIDPTFDENSYTLKWSKGVTVLNNGKKAIIHIDVQMIGESVTVKCQLVTTNSWHRYYGYDHGLMISFKAIPLP